MLNHRYKTLGMLMLTLFLVPAVHAQVSSGDVGTDKLAQSGFKFLEISTDARAAALGDALTAQDLGSSVAMFYNPAGMARLDKKFSASAGTVQWIADNTYNAASFAVNTGSYGVVGLTIVMADYGDNFIGTVAANNENGYTDYSDLGLADPSPEALSVGLGYAIALTDRFSVGAVAKYASQDLGTALITTAGETQGNSASTVALDFGILYKTGFRSLNFAMSIRNFAQEVTYVDENFELPLNFNVGVSMDMVDLSTMNPDVHSLILSVEGKRPRDFSEQIKVGAEYTFMDILSLRAGYSLPADEQTISLGAGLQYEVSGIGIGVNYAYTSFGIFSDVQRIGVQLSF
jgi:hypothetical protein